MFNKRTLTGLGLLFVAAAVYAAAPSITGTGTATYDSGNETIVQGTYPSGITSDTGLIACVAIDNDSNTLTWPGSWVEVFESSAGSSTLTSCARLDADGTESGTFNVSIGGTTQGGSILVDAVDGWDGSVDFYYSATPSSGFDTTGSPPSLTPGGGTGDYLYVALITTNDRPGSFSAYPSGYSDTALALSTSGGAATVAWGFRQLTSSSSEDPGDFTWTNSESFATWTLAIPETASGETTTCADTTIDPDGTQTIDCDLDVAFSGTITGLNCNSGGFVFDDVVSASTSSAEFNVVPGDTWVASGADFTLGEAVDCHLQNGSEISDTPESITFNLKQSGDTWAEESACDQDGSPTACVTDSVLNEASFPSGLIDDGDEIMFLVTSGTLSGISEHIVLTGTPPVVADVYSFDTGGDAWQTVHQMTAITGLADPVRRRCHIRSTSAPTTYDTTRVTSCSE